MSTRSSVAAKKTNTNPTTVAEEIKDESAKDNENQDADAPEKASVTNFRENTQKSSASDKQLDVNTEVQKEQKLRNIDRQKMSTAVAASRIRNQAVHESMSIKNSKSNKGKRATSQGSK